MTAPLLFGSPPEIQPHRSRFRFRWPFFLVALLVVAGLATFGWPAFEKSATDRTRAKYEAALQEFVPPEGVAVDPTGTACGWSLPGTCLTSDRPAAELVDAIRPVLAADGVELEEGCPTSELLPAYDQDSAAGPKARCVTGAAAWGNTFTVMAAEDALLPGKPRPRSWASISGDVTPPETSQVPEPATKKQTEDFLPASFTLGAQKKPAEGTLAAHASYRVISPKSMEATAAMNRLADHLVGLGFRVDMPCSAAKPCRHLIAQRRDAGGGSDDVSVDNSDDGMWISAARKSP